MGRLSRLNPLGYDELKARWTDQALMVRNVNLTPPPFRDQVFIMTEIDTHTTARQYFTQVRPTRPAGTQAFIENDRTASVTRDD